MKKKVDIAEYNAVSKETLANELVEAALAREQETKTSYQKKIDKVEIESKSQMRDHGKRSAKAVEHDREMSKKPRRSRKSRQRIHRRRTKSWLCHSCKMR